MDGTEAICLLLILLAAATVGAGTVMHKKKLNEQRNLDYLGSYLDSYFDRHNVRDCNEAADGGDLVIVSTRSIEDGQPTYWNGIWFADYLADAMRYKRATLPKELRLQNESGGADITFHSDRPIDYRTATGTLCAAVRSYKAALAHQAFIDIGGAERRSSK